MIYDLKLLKHTPEIQLHFDRCLGIITVYASELYEIKQDNYSIGYFIPSSEYEES